MSKGGVAGRQETPVAGSSVQTAVSVVLQYAKPSTTCDRSAAKDGSADVEVWRVRSSRSEAMIDDPKGRLRMMEGS